MKFVLSVCALFAILAACSSHPGVSIGNHKLEGSAVRIVPESGNEAYLVAIVDQETATISRFQVEEGSALRIVMVSPESKRITNLLQEITIPYGTSEGLIEMEATFNDDRNIRVILLLEGEEDISLAILEIDSVVVTSAFDLQDTPSGCDSGESNAALRIVDAACTELIACQARLTCSGCREIARNFTIGADPSESTLGQLSQGIDDGTVSFDSTLLDQCLGAIGGLSCQDVSSFSSLEDVENIGAIRSLFPGISSACENMFN